MMSNPPPAEPMFSARASGPVLSDTARGGVRSANDAPLFPRRFRPVSPLLLV